MSLNLIGNEKLMFDELGNPFFRKTTSKQGDYVDVQPQDSVTPCLKQLDLKIILKRNFYSPQGESRVWYGVQNLQIKIPNEKALRYYYLVYLRARLPKKRK